MDVLLDIDFKIEPEQMARRVRYVEHITGLKFRLRSVMETAHGYHFYISICRRGLVCICGTDIILLQLLLGSDYKREAFNWRRVMNGADDWNVLFRAKYRRVGSKLLEVSREKPAILWRIFYEFAYSGQAIKKELREWSRLMNKVQG